MRPLLRATLLVAAASLVRSHGFHDISSERDAAFIEEARWARRQAPNGAVCGPPSNAVCGAGLCCSPNNVCGTGIAYCGAPGCQLSFGPQCDGNQEPTGTDTSNVPRPLFGNVPYGVNIVHCTLNGYVALTFDDGPYIYTSDMLDLLKQNNVSATFFVVGANGGKGQIENASTGYPAIIRRMILEGHQVGSHTWSHQDLANMTETQRREQIIWNEMALVDILGFFPTYLRPPYTDWNQQTLNDLQALGYHVLNYDIDTRDWQGNYTYAQQTYSTILQQHSPATSSWISLAHDIENQTVHGFAQYMIDHARQLGYKLVPVGVCLGDAEDNWYRDPTTGQPLNLSKAISSLSAAVATASATSGSSAVPATTTVAPPSPSLPATPSSGPGSGSGLATVVSSFTSLSPSAATQPLSPVSSVMSSSHTTGASPATVTAANFMASSGNFTSSAGLEPTAAAASKAVSTSTKSSTTRSAQPPGRYVLVLAFFVLLQSLFHTAGPLSV